MYETTGTCSKMIDVTADENNIIQQVFFIGGCNGNLKAIGRLLEGGNAADAARILKGNDCGGRGTSCADQLARSIEEALSLTI